MRQWKTSMPQTDPADGRVHIVVSMKGNGRSRSEVSGELPSDQARAVRMLAMVSYDKFLKLKAAMDGVA